MLSSKSQSNLSRINISLNLIEFDWYDFSSKYQNLMNYGGNLHDVEISEFKAKQFLETSKSIIEKLTFEHMKKLKWYKENEIN